jgi:hypothetical protein
MASSWCHCCHTLTLLGSPNKRMKIPHRNVVLELMKIGEWRGGITSIGLGNMKKDGYERVVMVQGGMGGPIIAALKL